MSVETNEDEFKFKVSVPPRGKGLITKISIDTNSGGIYFSRSRFRVEICLWFIAIRFFFMSEEHYDALQAVVTMQKIVSTHKFIIGED